MSMKQAAEELLKIADEIEKDAAEVTEFVCDKCNHTATLASINKKRIEAAEGLENDVTVAEITVNDKISCPACEGTMSYHPTEASEVYYFDPEKVAKKEEEKEEEEEKTAKKEEKEEEEKAATSDPIDYDSLERYSS